MININNLINSNNFEIIEKITIYKDKQKELSEINKNERYTINKIEKEITNLLLEIVFLNSIDIIQSKYSNEQIIKVCELFFNNTENAFVFSLTSDEKEIYNTISKLNNFQLIFLQNWISKNKNITNNE